MQPVQKPVDRMLEEIAARRDEPTAAMQGAIDQWNGATTTAGASIDLPVGHSGSGEAP
jgi:hypothetical protein